MTDPANPPVRPENIPEKFWNAETGAVNTDALLASYTELETKLSAPPPAKTEDAQAATVETTQVAPPVVSNVDAYNAAVEKASAELAESDVLSEDSYKAFEAVGVSRAQVDNHINGQRAAYELRTLQVHQAAGGEENFTSLLQWGAAGNYSADEVAAFNQALYGSDKNAALAAVTELQNRYNTAMGTDSRLVMGESNNSVPGGYTNKTEWMTDLRNPAYKSDAAFREQVQKKLNIAVKNGVNLGVTARVG